MPVKLLRKQARVARRLGLPRVVDRDLAVEADRRAAHQRPAVLHAGGVDGMAGAEVVAAVEHHVGGRH